MNLYVLTVFLSGFATVFENIVGIFDSFEQAESYIYTIRAKECWNISNHYGEAMVYTLKEAGKRDPTYMIDRYCLNTCK